MQQLKSENQLNTQFVFAKNKVTTGLATLNIDHPHPTWAFQQ